jgi:lipopolysaccharide transport system ATP-binding protein
MQPIIRVNGLGKRYRIGRREASYETLRESLTRVMRAPWRAFRGGAGAGAGTVWALRDVSFDVSPGEVLGIIGRNGAGKSTLLKILSRITDPTEGGVDLYGRVGSLLEVGTGFHPELTGRENIFLNGAILGMRRREIRRKFDEIVDFAQIEQFADTPVKRYSSGMYMRLAFAVAAHMDTEILVIDEVLAVGDAEFQKRCLGRLEEVSSRGRTILFVSHSMPTILRLCSRAILLDGGRVVADGRPEEVARRYLQSDDGSPAVRTWSMPRTAPGDDVARLRAVRVLDERGRVADNVDIRKPFSIEVEYWDLQGGSRPTAVLHLVNETGVTLFATNDFNNRTWWETPRSPGLVRATCKLPGNFLAEGQVFVLAALCSYNPNYIHALEKDVVSFNVVDRSQGDGVRGPWVGPWPGVLRPMLEWEVWAEASATPSCDGRSTGESVESTT